MDVAIIGALVTSLLGIVGWMIAGWIKYVSAKLRHHDILHEESKQAHGLQEVKNATIVAHQENLTKTVDEIHDDVKKLVGYANGNSGRGTGQS